MAVDKFSHPDREFTGHPHHHDSWHANTMRLEGANFQLREYVLFDARRQQTSAHDGGHYAGRVEGDQWTPADWERIQEVRAELKGMCE